MALGYGDNAKAASHYPRHRGDRDGSACRWADGSETFSGLTGIGDLIVTCASMHSRNRRAGILIGQGNDDGRGHGGGAIWSWRASIPQRRRCALAEKYQIHELPIIEQVNQILFEGKDPKEAVSNLMLRDSEYREFPHSVAGTEKLNDDTRVKRSCVSCLHEKA